MWVSEITSSFVNAGKHWLRQKIPHALPIPHFMCCSIKIEQSSLLDADEMGTDGWQREKHKNIMLSSLFDKYPRGLLIIVFTWMGYHQRGRDNGKSSFCSWFYGDTSSCSPFNMQFSIDCFTETLSCWAPCPLSLFLQGCYKESMLDFVISLFCLTSEE